MTSGIFPILAIFAVLCAIAFFIFTGFSPAVQGESKPPEVRNGSLIMVEQTLKGEFPRPFHGKPDRAYEFKGLHFPVDLKSHARNTAYRGDIEQLSLYAELLRQNGYRTASFGFILNKARGSETSEWIRVNLLDQKAINQIFIRYDRLGQSNYLPKPSRGPKCRTCGQAANCSQTV